MTRPQTDELRALLDQQAAELEAAEAAELEQTSAAVRVAVAVLVAEAVRRWLIALADPRVNLAVALPSILLDAVARARGIDPPDLEAVAWRGLDLGLRHGGQQVGDGRSPGRPARLPGDLRQRVNALPDAITAQLDRAEATISEPGPPDADRRDRALSQVQRIVLISDAETASTLNRGTAAGVTRTARVRGFSTVWVPERDACLICLAYAGQVDTGSGFPVSKTFDSRPPPLPWPDPDRLPGPPRHPRCRCQLCVWSASWTSSGNEPLPEAIEREAKRSVVKGFALPSESEPARRRAADRLLQDGAGLPKTVEARARAAVRRRKRFTRPAP